MLKKKKEKNWTHWYKYLLVILNLMHITPTQTGKIKLFQQYRNGYY